MTGEMLDGGGRARAGGEFQTVKISITRRGVGGSCSRIRITDRWKSQKSRAQTRRPGHPAVKDLWKIMERHGYETRVMKMEYRGYDVRLAR